MAQLEDRVTIYDRINALEKELQSLTAEARGTEKSRKLLMAVSQQAVNALESGGDAIWRLLFHVCTEYYSACETLIV